MNKPTIRTQIERAAIQAIQPLKPALDGLAVGVQALEEAAHPQDTLLPGFVRRVQLDCYSCAAQSVAMVLEYYRDPVPLKDLVRELGTDEEGTSMRAVATFFRRREYVVKSISGGYPKRLRDAIDAGRPVIVRLDGDHAAVVYGHGLEGKDTAFWVSDPALSRRVLCRHTADALRARWEK